MRLLSRIRLFGMTGIFLLTPPSVWAQPVDRGQSQAALIFQILASELAVDQGELGVAATTYLTMARATQNVGAARRATELAIQARLPQRAEEAAEIWLKNAPTDLEAQGTLDLLHLMLGRNDKLLQSLTTRRDLAAKEDRLDSFYDYLSGLTSRSPDRLAASKLYGAVAKSDLKRPAVLYSLAMLEERAGNFETMEALLRDLIAIDPKHAHAHNALGYHLADRNIRLEEAQKLIERAFELAPNDAHIIDSVGWVHFRMGRIDLAEKYLRQAHEQQPDVEISAHLGEVLWASGRREEAENFWRAAIATDPRNEVLQETLKRLGVPPLKIQP
jgi:tetratricopeptide (TPR) repeat protein